MTRAHRLLRDNGLSLVLAALFALTMVGQAESGLRRYNEERAEHGQPALSMSGYLATGHFLEATAENWESEFLQLAAYVVLTAILFQKGSSESKKIGQPEAVDRRPSARRKNAPWPVRRGGWVLKLYENSLSLTFLLLFLICIVLHAIGGAAAHNEEQAAQGGASVSAWEYARGAQFWFESLQNWQSEFLSLLAMVVLSIFLRQRGSPESKPVDAPHSSTGSS
ncbi:MAG TPA: DUF6766 family protein [Steroidobacteraceae bacterium]|nr:DUF6766 family protein [Steroidobacteraceae bacterium]